MLLRFHLHPDIGASLARGGRAARLTTPAGVTLMFDAEGLPVSLEESVHLADRMGPRRTSQIVVRVRTGQAARLAWQFVRADA